MRTFAEGRKAGQIEIGEEHPYEWVEPRRMGVLREYSQGPFRWLVSTVELTPRPGGGTTLVHRLRLEPSSWTDPSRIPLGGGRQPPEKPGARSISASTRPSRVRASAALFTPAILLWSRLSCRPRVANGWNGCWTDWPNKASTRRLSSDLAIT